MERCVVRVRGLGAHVVMRLGGWGPGGRALRPPGATSSWVVGVRGLGVWWCLELLLPGCGWVSCRVVLFVLLACLHDPGRLLGVRCCGIWFWWVG